MKYVDVARRIMTRLNGTENYSIYEKLSTHMIRLSVHFNGKAKKKDSTVKNHFGIERLKNISCLNLFFLYSHTILIYVLQYI